MKTLTKLALYSFLIISCKQVTAATVIDFPFNSDVGNNFSASCYLKSNASIHFNSTTVGNAAYRFTINPDSIPGTGGDQIKCQVTVPSLNQSYHVAFDTMKKEQGDTMLFGIKPHLTAQGCYNPGQYTFVQACLNEFYGPSSNKKYLDPISSPESIEINGGYYTQAVGVFIKDRHKG